MGAHEYRFINLFRALAAFWVLAAHCQIWGGYTWAPIPAPKIAVDLFMLVSGFLMAVNADTRWSREPMTDPGARVRFWLRRYFRIAPAYYLALAVVILSAPVLMPGKAYLQSLEPARWVGTIYDASAVDFSLDNVLMHVSFLFGLHPDYAYSTSLPDWSLGLEMQFYLAFPFLLLWLRTPLRALVVGLLIFGTGRLLDQVMQFPEPSFLLLKLNYFLAGMLLFMAMHRNGRIRVGAFVAALLLASLGFEYGHWRFLAPLLLLAMMTLGLLEQAQRTPALIARAIDSPPVRFASDVSYSVYLFHGIMFGVFGVLAQHFALEMSPRLLTAALFVFAVTTSYTVGYVVYRWVELPGIRLGKRILTRFPTSAAVVPG